MLYVLYTQAHGIVRTTLEEGAETEEVVVVVMVCGGRGVGGVGGDSGIVVGVCCWGADCSGGGGDERLLWCKGSGMAPLYEEVEEWSWRLTGNWWI